MAFRARAAGSASRNCSTAAALMVSMPLLRFCMAAATWRALAECSWVEEFTWLARARMPSAASMMRAEKAAGRG